MDALYLPRGKAAVAVLLAACGFSACALLTPPDRWLAGGFLSAMLAWATMVDIDRLILPNLLTIPLLIAGLLNAAFTPEPQLTDAIVGAALGYSVFIAIGALFARVRGVHALGQGDAKLMAAAGAWLGWSWLPYVTLIASTAALLAVAIGALAFGRQIAGAKIAFGPFIALALGVCWVFTNAHPA